MNTQEYFQKLRDIKDTSMATIGFDGMPHVRIIDTMLVEDEKLYFLTARGKAFYRELMNTQTVAITGLNREWETVRVWGRIQNIGHKYLDRIFKENPAMNDIYPGKSRDILEVFCLYEGQGEYFCLANHPIIRHSFQFDNQPVKRSGFEIGDECIACGTCKRVCPQNVIDEGIPYKIRQDNCLHCGRCFENCPVQAIVERG